MKQILFFLSPFTKIGQRYNLRYKNRQILSCVYKWINFTKVKHNYSKNNITKVAK